MRRNLLLVFLAVGVAAVVATMSVALLATHSMHEIRMRLVRNASQYLVGLLEPSALQPKGGHTTFDATTPPIESLNRLMDRVAATFQLPGSARLALVGPDLRVLVSRPPSNGSAGFPQELRLSGAYVESIEVLADIERDSRS